MWGDPERAVSLDTSDPLSMLLFQITSPAHIPYNDIRWEELLHGYNVWVHIELPDDEGGSSSSDPYGIIKQACKNMKKHASTSSNLASLSIHVIKMLYELQQCIMKHQQQQQLLLEKQQKQQQQHQHYHPQQQQQQQSYHPYQQQQQNFMAGGTTAATTTIPPPFSFGTGGGGAGGDVNHFSQRIELVQKSRTTAGALQLLRILVHGILPATIDSPSLLQEMFTYKSRDSYYVLPYNYRKSKRRKNHNNSSNTNNIGHDLILALAYFLSSLSPLSSSKPSSSSSSSSDNNMDCINIVTLHPELYDVTVLVFHLLLVLLSTQLYQPMISSFQIMTQQQQQQQQSKVHNYFLEILYHQALKRYRKQEQQNQDNNNNNQNSDDDDDDYDWSPKQLLDICLQWQILRPRAPSRSITNYHTELAKSVVALKGEKLGVDGLFETHLAVTASTAPKKAEGEEEGSTSSHHPDDLHPGGGSHHPSNYYYDTNNRSLVSKGSGRLLDATKGVLVLSSSIILLPWRLMNLALGLFGAGVPGGSHNHHHHAPHNNNQGLLAGIIGHYYNTYYASRSNPSPTSSTAHRPLIHNSNTTTRGSKLTKDVIWISDSPIADLATSLLLILTNNQRFSNNSNDTSDSNNNNAFRMELSNMTDTRWDELEEEQEEGIGITTPEQQQYQQHDAMNGTSSQLYAALLSQDHQQQQHQQTLIKKQQPKQLTVDFEALFVSFGKTLHTEVGALSLYTLLQSSQLFAQSIAVRSDLDTLVLPLLRTLYFSSSLQRYYSDHASTSTTTSTSSSNNSHLLSARNCPFRSQSQLYVIVILLLLFSQDVSFGADIFKRIVVTNAIPWYKERVLKDINLGSILLLVLLRSLTFNLNRLHDPFLLSNCCAILMNLCYSSISPSAAASSAMASSATITNLHEYTSMRLASVSIACLKKYKSLYLLRKHKRQQQQQQQQQLRQHEQEEQEQQEEILDMYAEVCSTLLHVLKHCLTVKNIEQNKHLVYALMYHQAEWKALSMTEGFSKSQATVLKRIQHIISVSSNIIMQATEVDINDKNKTDDDNRHSSNDNHNSRKGGGGTQTASQALRVLMYHMNKVRKELIQFDSNNYNYGNGQDVEEDYTFTYEEEEDPEIFFVPYVWEVIVCVVTASSLEWKKRLIRVFPLLEEEEVATHSANDYDDNSSSQVASGTTHNNTVHNPNVYSQDVSDVV